ncbi:CLUMA_CG018781, isoform A [Clunio marinus]|uniref:CLUMA_CG018781, isoform A n=1 Tax=Clunio marinus TaxID=568069 RepID=A0A1J1J091_9DIPT|nr:CLUMA_CG018781, isoform A [Clunio marinus]
MYGSKAETETINSLEENKEKIVEKLTEQYELYNLKKLLAFCLLSLQELKSAKIYFCDDHDDDDDDDEELFQEKVKELKDGCITSAVINEIIKLIWSDCCVLNIQQN